MKEQKAKQQKTMHMIESIKGTYHTAVEMQTCTARLRNELSEQLINNLAGGEGEALVDADVRIPKIFTAKAYAEHLSGAPLTDATTIKKLREETAQAFHKAFNMPATRVLPQAREGRDYNRSSSHSPKVHRKPPVKATNEMHPKLF